MHRSGTSALTRVVSLLGAELPKRIMGATPGNPTGHWEPEALIRVNERMLAELGSQWYDWRNLDQRGVKRYADQIDAVIAEEYEGAELFVLKDPRISRLVPVYKAVLDRMGVETLVIICLRNPLEVAESLAKRDRLTRSFTGLVWARHMLEAEAGTRGLKRAFVEYDRLLQDWRIVVENLTVALGLEFPVEVGAVASEIGAFLDPSHRNNIETMDAIFASPELDDWVKATYAALQNIVENPDGREARSTLDRIRRECDHAAAVVGKSVMGQITADRGEIIQLRRDQERLREELKNF
jgi:hypothetical protein